MAKKKVEPVKLESYFDDYNDDDEIEVIEDDFDADEDYDEYVENYEDFNKVKDIEDDVTFEEPKKNNIKKTKHTDYSSGQKHKSYKEVYKELDEVDDDFEAARFGGILSVISLGFRIIGIIIAIILIAYFISTGQFKNLILYILGLIIAFFFGWFFMYFLVKFTENN